MVVGKVFYLIPAGTPIPVFSGMNKGLRWVRGAANAPEWMGIYERDKQRLLQKYVRPGMTVFDIGANAGFYSLGLSRMVGTRGRVIAFEPFGKNVEKILRHIRLNGLENIQVVQAAVAKSDGLCAFNFGESDFEGSLAGNHAGQYLVPTVQLGAGLSKGILPYPDLLKIDVEGAESQLLEGSAVMLAEHHPVIFLALHGSAQKRLCHSILRSLNYTIEDFDGIPISAADQMPDEVIAYFRNV